MRTGLGKELDAGTTGSSYQSGNNDTSVVEEALSFFFAPIQLSRP
jgi:hypothetical protein